MLVRFRSVTDTPRGLFALAFVLLGACDPGDFGRRDRGGSKGELPPPGDPNFATDGMKPGDAQVATDAGVTEELPGDASFAGPGAPTANDPSDAAIAEAGTNLIVLDGGAAADAASARDGSHPDATPQDVSPRDAAPPVPVGQSACYSSAFASRALCEGFEVAPESPRFRIHATGGTLAHSAARTQRGIGALLASSTSAGGNAFVQRAAFAKLKSGTIYLRSYLYIPRGPRLDTVVVHGFAEDPTPYGGISVVLRDRGGELDVHPIAPGEEHEFVIGPDMAIPRDAWFCLQFSVTISDTEGAVVLAIDGKQVAAKVGDLDTLPADGYSLVTAGVIYTEPTQAPVQLYVDEFVADTKPIACD